VVDVFSCDLDLDCDIVVTLTSIVTSINSRCFGVLDHDAEGRNKHAEVTDAHSDDGADETPDETVLHLEPARLVCPVTLDNTEKSTYTDLPPFLTRQSHERTTTAESGMAAV
jgi:hypothetical protein